jgi:hypothetical protein
MNPIFKSFIGCVIFLSSSLTWYAFAQSNEKIKSMHYEKTARTTENSIYIEKVKHDLNIKSTYSDSFYLYFNLF